ncbi:RNA-binding transcriptional accessory protein [Thalassotalea sp. LPB0316]|uniref:Tex family protein n=1 Tax=Thalassotalea sp. LPB0316 TaxID=2769490 RepID=UPI001868E376|nr:Tex family protein [Thalassotalea sp. LPB0316]QOL26245.1 RNA-binding transcriptional accessory protein [Thalassotalea sp. LPB0316]
MSSISQQIATELNVKAAQVDAAVKLLDEGATVPFIARYRKEATQGLDDNHLRVLAQRLVYLRELNERKQVVLINIEQQGKLTDALKQAIERAENKTQVEDIYLPFKPKRRTKGQIAIEAGLAPLAMALFTDIHKDPEQEANAYIDATKGLDDTKAVLDGASFILIEHIAEQATLVQKLRRLMQKQGQLTSSVVKGKNNEAVKYRDYFEHSEKLAKVPSHRALAMLRGRNEGFLQLAIAIDPEGTSVSSAEQMIAEHFNFRLTKQAGAAFIQRVIRLAWKTKLSLSLENEALGQLREQAELEAIKVFAKNLTDLLMAAPAGEKVTLGLDPGLRTGCKLAVVDGTGKLLATNTIFPHAPQNNWDKSMRTIVNLCRQHKVELIAIGNGTGSRESDKLVAEAIQMLENNKPTKVMVSEAGASVYSASEFAAEEFSELDVSLRGAVSIARRLQDPLAELVKIDPKAIGVGQYQHDVSQSLLSQSLDDVIEDCVNKVGVDLNQASMPLLARVSGLNKTIAQNIVAYREQNGRFNERKQLLKVARLGPKAFEQSAGFLRIREGENPLDMSGVHPETYAIVEKIIEQLGQPINEVIGQASIASKVNTAELTSDDFGEITVNDVIAELEKPGRDPRPEFKTATFQEGVETISDLKVGMILEGVISNVANFGAFVDIGVHQDGLVHISAITDKFISDPREVVKAGDIVKVKVLEVDADRKRITLTMRLTDKAQAKPQHKANQANGQQNKPKQQNRPKQKAKPVTNAAMGNAFADAFAKMKK